MKKRLIIVLGVLVVLIAGIVIGINCLNSNKGKKTVGNTTVGNTTEAKVRSTVNVDNFNLCAIGGWIG